MRCRFYLHGKPSQFLTDLYNAVEEINPNLGMIHDILKHYKVIQQRYGKMFIYQGEDSSIALNHVRRINRRYPNLIAYEYKGQTSNRFGRENNEKYTFEINTAVLNNVKNMSFPEDAIEIEKEERLAAQAREERDMRLAEQSLSEQVRRENTSENKSLFGKEEEKSESVKKADKLKHHFKGVGVDINVNFTNDLAPNVSADITGTGPRSADVRLNNKYLQDDSVYHEFGHAYIDLLGIDNTLVKQAFKQLKGSEIEKTVLNSYPGLEGVKLQKEVLATAIGLEGAKLEKKNPSKIQILLHKIFRSIGKLLGINQNAAAILAEQMFAGEIRSKYLIGEISGFTQESKDRNSLQKKIDDVRIYTRKLKRIAEQRNDAASQARAEALEQTLENIKSLEDFISFIDMSAKITSNIANKYQLLQNKIKAGEKIETSDQATLAELNQYIQGFDILEGLEVLFTEEKQNRVKQTTAFNTAYDKLGAVVRQRKYLEQQYIDVAIPIQAEFLSPYISQEVNENLDSLIQNIDEQEGIDNKVLAAKRHLDKKDNNWIQLNKDLKQKRISEEEYKNNLISLVKEQLENKKMHKKTLIQILTRAHKDGSTFSYWMDPLVWSNDNAIQLFALAVKDALYEGDEKSRETQYKIQELYNNFTEGVTGINNVQKLYEDLTEDIKTWVRDEDGSYKQIDRAGWVQELDMPRYQKNKQQAVEQAKNKTYFRERKDFESDELFEDYKNSIVDYKVNGKVVYKAQTKEEAYRLVRRAFGEAMGKWRQENTVPKRDAQEIMRKHEDKIAYVYKEMRPLQKKLDDNTITSIEIEKLNSLEIELSILDNWRQTNYYVNPRYPDSLTPKGSLVQPSQGEKLAGGKNRVDYTNSKYKAIMADPRKKKFYEGMISIYKEHQNKLGSAGHQLGKDSFSDMAYALPSIRKVDKDRAIEQGVLKTMKEWWVDGTDITDTDYHIYGQRWETIGGKQRKVVPAFFTNAVDKNEISLDLTSSLLAFVGMANTYEAKAGIQAQVQIMSDLIEHRETDLTSPSGIKIINDLAKGLGIEQARSKEGRESNNFKHLTSFLDQNVFGEKAILKQFSFFGKQFEANKLSGKLAGYTAMNALSFNLLQGVNQNVLDNIIGYSEASAGQFIDKKSLLKGKNTYWSKGGAIGDLGKIAPTTFVGQIAEMYDMIQGEFRDNLGKNVTGTNAKKLFSSDAMFFLQHGAEHEVQVSRGLGMLAFMKAKDKKGKQLKNPDGSDMTMLDAHSQDSNGRVKVDERVANFDRMRFMNRIHGINKRTNGVYNDFDAAHLKRHWYGKLAMLFRGWMVPGYRRRFGHGEPWHSDHELGAITQGTYMTFYKMLRDSIKTQSNQYKNMSELEKQNVRRVSTEIYALATTFAIASAAALLIDPDDEEPNSWAVNFLLYQNRRLRSELFFYVNPHETWRLTKSPTATIRPLENIGAFALSTLENMYYFGLGNLGGLIPEKNIYYQRKSGANKKGELKWDNKLEKAIPILKGIGTSKTPGEAIKWFNM